MLISGCSSGIGRCVAKGLSERGYPVIATARKSGDVEALRAEGFTSTQLDLDNSASIETAVDWTLEQTNGRLYGLFNNGAYAQPGAVEDLSREVLRRQFETNLFGTHELTRRVLPVMRRLGQGRIIQNSSVLGFAALAFRGAYNASKFALEGLADTLRLELVGTGIHISLIEPGPVESRFRANAYAAFKRNIDADNSPFRETYTAVEQRLASEGAVVPFTVPPEAVLRRVVHALESRRPRVRYPVTLPTYFFAFAKRLFTHRALDRLLQYAGGYRRR